MSRKDNSNNTEFGVVLDKILVDRKINRSALSRLIKCTPAYISFIMRGKRYPTAELVDKISFALELEGIKTLELHRIAAKVHGFKV